MTNCCNPHRVLTSLLLLVLLAAGGCGQKGPLVYNQAQQERVDARDMKRRQQELQQEQESGPQDTQVEPSPADPVTTEPADQAIDEQESDLEDQ